ncbi:TAXI family TRAP transporter solute-binding subunit [Roseinatronobacter sp.]|uniref:TAXI family TRAP transporter solute-binding subunit n=1 Tax=Roseinatronobacter sp. TaxID=1945755 RepID=UPI003F6F0463
MPIKLRYVTAAAAFAVMAQPVLANDVSLSLLSQPPGGSWYSYGSTFGEIISDAEGEVSISVEVLPRGGGMTNPVAVSQGVAELAFVSANAAVWARDGIGEDFEGRNSEDIRAVIGGLQIAHSTIAARKAYVERTGQATLEAMMAGPDYPRIVMKPQGSQVPIMADYMFQAMGSSLEDMRDKGAVTQISTAQIAQMLRDGTADVYIENSPVGQATMTEVTMTTDMVFIPFPQEVLDHMTTLGAPAGDMPEGSYPGQDGAYTNPTSATILIANKDVPQDVIYQVTRALVEQREAIAEAFPALADWDPEAGAQPDQAVIALHEGAARYYRERGWID